MGELINGDIRMRDLTEEELALAPEWATHYVVDEVGDVLFESREYFEWLIDGVLNGRGDNYEIYSTAVKINRKPFDITQHEWSDVIAEIEPESCHTLVIKSHGSWLSFDKDDVIAMARDRGVTAEDLK